MWCFLNQFMILSAPYMPLNITICDQASENRACGHMILAYFFSLSELITFYPNMILQWNFQHLLWIYFVLWCSLQNKNILLQYWDMTFVVCAHMPCFRRPSHILPINATAAGRSLNANGVIRNYLISIYTNTDDVLTAINYTDVFVSTVNIYRLTPNS